MKKKLMIFFAISILIINCTPKQEKAKNYYKEGIKKTYYSDYTGAIEDFNKAIKYNPEYIEAYLNRGNCKANLRNYKGALEDYDKAIELNPDYADAYENRGHVKFYLHDKDGSCEDYLKAEELGKENLFEKTKWCK